MNLTRTGRSFIGIEKDPEMFEVAKARVEKAYADNPWWDVV